MRKLVFSSGSVSVTLFVLGCFFKILHTTFGGPMMGFGMLIFAIIFVPSATWYYYHKGK